MTQRRSCAFAVLVMTLFALPLLAESGVMFKHRPTTSSATLFFSGSFGYSVGGGKARVMAQDVTNSGTSTTGNLRFSLYWTPNGPYPSNPAYNTAQHVMGTLAPGQHFSNVDSGLTLPFTDPGNGCYYVTLALEQFVGGVWQVEDYGNFSLRISSGQGCLFSFSASPTTVSPGGTSTLSWSTGGSSVTIDNGLGSRPANGSVNVTPSATTTYTLTVNGTADGTPRTGQATVTVATPPPAPTATFSASPTTITAGQSTTLTWTTSNATSVSIDNGVGSKPVNGSASVCPTTTTTYTLSAAGAGGQILRQATVTVNPANGPTVTFSASPAQIAAGQSSVLSWSTTNATTVTIDNGVGSKPLSGTANVSPTGTTTYRLTAVGPGGTSTAQATVFVLGTPTITVTADPLVIKPGESSTLSWTTTNATSVEIDQGIGLVSLGGTRKVTPSSTTTYKFTATGVGGTTTQSVTVVIGGQPTKRRAVRH